MNHYADQLNGALADRYRVDREVGQGDMATVYLAHDLKHDRDVASKVLHPDLGAALGGELFVRNGASMMAVTVRTGATLDVDTPRELFRGNFLEDETGDRSNDVMPDGQHFIMLRANPAAAPDLRVVRNWSLELEAMVPR